MGTFKVVGFILLTSIVAFGCSKKQDISSITSLGVEGEDRDIVTETITSPEAVESFAQPLQPIQVEAMPKESAPVIPLEAEGMERNKQIQAALKNANLYFGQIDGKIGPLTRKAIEEFQKMKGLKVDGKVGPITWGELQKYLNIQPSGAEAKNKR